MTDNTYPFDPKRALLIHASAVRTDDGALIFLGPSGAGKSTICRLLSTFAQPLADDMVFLIPQVKAGWAVADAKEYVFSGGLSEQKGILKGMPLQAVFRLCQASEPHLRRIHTLETCRHLAAAFFETLGFQQYNTGATEKKQAFSYMASAARSVPGYCLYFDRSLQTAEMIKEVSLWQSPIRKAKKSDTREEMSL